MLYYNGYLPSFSFSELFSSYLPSSTLFSNPNGFFSKMLVGFYHREQNVFSKHCSPCCFAPKKACFSVREFFGYVKQLLSTLCEIISTFMYVLSMVLLKYWILIQRIVISMKVNTYLAPTYKALVFLSYLSPNLNHILY